MIRPCSRAKQSALIAFCLALPFGFSTDHASSREGESSFIEIHLATSPEISLGEQHINQEILKWLLVTGARQLPEVARCDDVHQLYQIKYMFGDFAVAARHTNPAQRVACLRGIVRYLLREKIKIADFVAARAAETKFARERSEPDLKYRQKIIDAVERLAFLEIYRKYSPLHQLHSVDADNVAAVQFDDFMLWLERSRKDGRFAFFGQDALLQALDLPVPDRMVLQPTTSLESLRMPAGVLFFDGERFKVPALIMLYAGHDETTQIDAKARRRFACNQKEPSDLGDGFDGIEDPSCRTSDHFGDIWFTLLLRKSDGVSNSEFCRRVRELSRDEDVATMARFSPDGSKGLYVLLPPACQELK